MVTSNARTKEMTKKEKKYKELTHQPQLSRKMYSLIILFKKR